jgi:pyruvate dehydrogenase E1 component
VECNKVIWGSDWDPILEKDKEGKLVKRLGEISTGNFKNILLNPVLISENIFLVIDEDLLEDGSNINR